MTFWFRGGMRRGLRGLWTILSEGHSLPWISPLIKVGDPSSVNRITDLSSCSSGDRKQLEAEIDQGLECGRLMPQSKLPTAIQVTVPRRVEWAQPTKPRIIDNFRSLNCYLEKAALSVQYEYVSDAPWIGRCAYFSKFDLKSAYWQIPVAPDDVPYLGFETLPHGRVCTHCVALWSRICSEGLRDGI